MQTRSPIVTQVLPLLAILASIAGAGSAQAQTRDTIVIRGHQHTLYLYGPPSAEPVIVSSGDGGWIHLGPYVAQVLSARGFFVVGFDAKAYLESFTSSHSSLTMAQEPGDYLVLADFVKARTGKKPILIGVSEGAGLSVLAATDPRTRDSILGVIGLGLPDMNELAWRWKDSLIYLTHRPPNEPGFSSADIVERVAPIPLAAIHSTHDEFVPIADIQHVINRAGNPKRLWMVNAADHRFSNNLSDFTRALMEAIAWVKDNAPR